MNFEIQSQKQTQINNEFINFVQLLHRGLEGEIREGKEDRGFAKELSIIYSASQLDTLRTEKELFGSSCKEHFIEKQTYIQNQMSTLFEELFRTQLSPLQAKLLKQLQQHTRGLQSEHQKSSIIIRELQGKLLNSQQKNAQIQSLLRQNVKSSNILHENQKQLLLKHQNALQSIQISQESYNKTRQQLQKLENDNNFLKNLIINANENYEALEKKMMEMKIEGKGSKITISDRSTSKSSFDDYHLQSSRPQKKGDWQVILPKSEEVYRKMVKRVLKERSQTSISK